MTVEERKLTQKRLEELANRAYYRGRYVFSTFLSAEELACLYENQSLFSYAFPKVFGGYEGAERCVVRFGALPSYDEKFPVVALKIAPTGEKFSEPLTHRDFLGAIMNLGIERSAVGDVVVKDNSALVYCLQEMQDYIVTELKRVKHTSVRCVVTSAEEEATGEKVTETYFLSSLRADCAVAAVFHLSREDAQKFFDLDRVFVNGQTVNKASKELCQGDKVTVRGKGRFFFKEVVGESKKGRLRCEIERDAY